MKKITVIGAGSWGTALAMVLSDNQFDVSIHTHKEEVANEINQFHTNEKYLPGITLNKQIIASTQLKTSLSGTELILIVVPSHAMRSVAKEVSPYLENHENEVTIVHASKGIENHSLLTMSQVLEEELPSQYKNQIVTISGPSHAEEVSRKILTTLVAASKDIEEAKKVQNIFNNHYFRVYTNPDIHGVELGGALKNIIALGAGISDGLGLGDNGKAALLTRGLTEMTRLGVTLGANEKTFSGLAGIGDLIVTGTSKHSRNWRTGNLLATGYSLDEALKIVGMVSEGVKTTKSAYFLAKKLNVDTPIIDEIYRILFEGKAPKEATKDLMTRVHKDEL